jgi:hypothetical protein
MIAINETYSINEIKSEGFKEKPLKELTAKVFEKEDKIYFFDPIDGKKYRLYSIIHKRSFFL